MAIYKYVGTGEIKKLDKDNEKTGAFLQIDIQDILEAIEESLDQDEMKLNIIVLPNKANDSYNVKVKIG
jgi:hypothetical protein